MRISFKPVIDNSEQLNLRISPALKQRIEELRVRSKNLGLDLNATLAAYIEEFVGESEAQLDALEASASKSVAKQSGRGGKPATKSVATPLAEAEPVGVMAGANGAGSAEAR